MLATTLRMVLAIHQFDVARSFSHCSKWQVSRLSRSIRRAARVSPVIFPHRSLPRRRMPRLLQRDAGHDLAQEDGRLDHPYRGLRRDMPKAGDRTRTDDIHVGNVTLYH